MTNKRRVVFVSEYLGFECNSTSYYWTKILESLEEEFNVLVVAPSSLKNLDYLVESNNEYVTYPYISFDKSNMYSRLWAYIRMGYAINSILKSRVEKNDIVISGTNPIFNLFFIANQKRRVGFKWLLFGYDIFPENLIPAEIVGKFNPLYKLSVKAFAKLYSSPSMIIAVGRDMKALLESKTQYSVPITYVPNWADHDDTYPLDRQFNALESKIIFQFFGNIGKLQDIENLLNAIALVNSDNVEFHFIGSGGEAMKIENYIQKLGDSRVIFKGQCPMSGKNQILSECDVAFVSLKKGMYGLAVPSKSYFSLAANKPILVVGDEGAELYQLVNEYPIGWNCEADNPSKLASIIENICNSPSCLSNLQPRKKLVEHFNEKHSLKKIKDIVSNL